MTMAKIIKLQIPYAVQLEAERQREKQYRRWLKFMQLQSGLVFLQLETKLLKAASSLFLAFTDEKGIYEGAKVVGTAKVTLYGLTFGVPVSEDVTLSI